MSGNKPPPRSKECQLSMDLIDAINRDAPKEITRLISAGADVNYQNNLGWTNLQQACLDGDISLVQKLLNLGADINLADCCGWSPLHEACFFGSLEIVKILIAAGANPNQIMGEDDLRLPIDVAREKGYLDIVDFLMEITTQSR